MCWRDRSYTSLSSSVPFHMGQERSGLDSPLHELSASFKVSPHIAMSQHWSGEETGSCWSFFPFKRFSKEQGYILAHVVPGIKLKTPDLRVQCFFHCTSWWFFQLSVLQRPEETLLGLPKFEQSLFLMRGY